MDPSNGIVEFSMIMLHPYNKNADFYLEYLNNEKSQYTTRFVMP